MSTEVRVGQYIKTPRGPGLVTAIDWQQARYHVTLDPEPSMAAIPVELWVDIEDVVDDDVLDADLHDMDTVEKYLSGESVAPQYARPQAAYNVPCQSLCRCMWCSRISSNGFHFHNPGQCRCEKNGCPCLVGQKVD